MHKIRYLRFVVSFYILNTQVSAHNVFRFPPLTSNAEKHSFGAPQLPVAKVEIRVQDSTLLHIFLGHIAFERVPGFLRSATVPVILGKHLLAAHRILQLNGPLDCGCVRRIHPADSQNVSQLPPENSAFCTKLASSLILVQLTLHYTGTCPLASPLCPRQVGRSQFSFGTRAVICVFVRSVVSARGFAPVAMTK